MVLVERLNNTLEQRENELRHGREIILHPNQLKNRMFSGG